MDKLAEGKQVFDREIQALCKTRDALDETFVAILDLILHCKGKVILTGMGKSGHIAKKLAATFSSLGTPSFYLHPGEAMHGDLGMVSKEDLVIAISYSGETDELIRILPGIKWIGAAVVGITGNGDSTLARASTVVQVLPDLEEACSLGLAPTSSTTAALCYGDALSVAASVMAGFRDEDFGKFHPAGSLGKKLILRVDDLMAAGEANAAVPEHVMLKDLIVEISKKGLGLVSVVDESEALLGVVTDGDIRRQMEKGVDIYALKVREMMTKNPITIESGKLAIEALTIMKNHKNISCLPVVRGEKLVGALRIHDILAAGIVG